MPPAHGDLVLAQVVEIGQHAKLELTTSRRAALYLGDEIVVGMGAGYVPGAEHDQKVMAAAAQQLLLAPTPPLPRTCPLPNGDPCP